MRHIVGLGAILIVSQLSGGPSQASGASLLANVGALSPSLDGHSLARRVGWNRCQIWRDKCAWRWGPGTWRFDRCLRRHGC